MASSLGEGQLALLSYALKLVELPQVLLIGVLVVVLYPDFHLRSRRTKISFDRFHF